MSKRLNELRQKRSQAIADARKLIDKAAEEGRSMNDEERAQYDKHWADQESYQKQIDDEQRQIEAERELASLDFDPADNRDHSAPRETRERRDYDPANPQYDTDEYRSAFRKFMLGQRGQLNEAEARALSAGTDTEGGYTVVPEQFIRRLIKSVDDLVFIRQRATKFQLATAASMGVPTLAADPADADWTTELQTGSEDSSMGFGKRALAPNPLAKRIKLSKTLIRLSALGVESLAMQRLSYKFAITQEKAFLTGSGDKQPLGLFTASNDGIPTSRDVSADNEATSITFDGLINAKYSLKGQYWSRADWLFHRDALKQVSKLKDSNDGQYIWRESVRAGEPDRLLGRPVEMSEYVPNTFTANQYVGILGDFSQYWVVDALDMTLQVLTELYAETNQNGYIGRLEVDGAPVLPEAFARVKLASGG